MQVSELNLENLKQVMHVWYSSATTLKKKKDDMTTKTCAMDDRISAAMTLFNSSRCVQSRRQV